MGFTIFWSECDDHYPTCTPKVTFLIHFSKYCSPLVSLCEWRYTALKKEEAWPPQCLTSDNRDYHLFLLFIMSVNYYLCWLNVSCKYPIISAKIYSQKEYSIISANFRIPAALVCRQQATICVFVEEGTESRFCGSSPSAGNEVRDRQTSCFFLFFAKIKTILCEKKKRLRSITYYQAHARHAIQVACASERLVNFNYTRAHAHIVVFYLIRLL